MIEEMRGMTETEIEEHELETLVEVLGDNVAQRCVAKHVLPQLIDAEQRGYWKV